VVVDLRCVRYGRGLPVPRLTDIRPAQGARQKKQKKKKKAMDPDVAAGMALAGGRNVARRGRGTAGQLRQVGLSARQEQVPVTRHGLQRIKRRRA